ncbi:MAG TPA: F0F1 ATP synthase subunit gamma [bacterium]|nr:F0F1 ATP synthase subunit gamma [bacterium]
MKTLTQLRQEKENLIGLGELTEALKYLSAAKMTKIKKKVLANRYFLQEALTTKTELQKYLILLNKKKALSRKKGKDDKQDTTIKSNASALIIAVMSNQGLCGIFNSQLAKKIIKDFPTAEPDLVIIGRRGKGYFGRSKFAGKLKVVTVPEEVSITDLDEVFSNLKLYSHVYIYYNMYITAVKSDPVQATFSSSPDEHAAEKIKKNVKEDSVARTYIVEPNFDDVLEYFQTVIAEAIFMQQVLESRLSENNSRMLAMKEANDNIAQLLDEQKKEFNRIRRAKINQALTEVFAGRALW